MAVDMFLKLGDYKGESQDAAHKDEIDVLSWNWGTHQSGTTHLGGGGGSGKVHVDDLTITKYVDKSTPNIFKGCCKGTHIPEAKLTVRKAGDKPLEYLKITMKDIVVSSYATGGNSDKDRITETVTLNFAQVKVEYTPQKKDGSGEASIPVGWNVAQNVEAA
jgi:type VI secretion system secreted protein Hcp